MKFFYNLGACLEVSTIQRVYEVKLILYRLFDTRTMSISHNFPRKQYIQMCCDVSSDGNY